MYVICLNSIIYEMIEKVNNLNKKSFKNYTGPNSENKFKSVNIFFGYNGRGKSTLAEGIVDEYIKTNNNIDSIRFYNKRYIKDHLLLENDETMLKGIKVNFGNKNVNIAGKIKELEKQKKNIDEQVVELEKRKEKLQEDAKKLYEEYKGDSNIRFVQIDWDDPYKKYYSDFDVANKYTKIIELKKLPSKESFFEDLKFLESMDESPIIKIELNEINKIYEIFQKNYDDSKIPAKDILEWIKEGKDIHKNHNSNRCLFCGSYFDYGSLLTRIERYESDDTQKARSFLDIMYKKINDQIKSTKKIVSDKIIISRILGDNSIIHIDNISKTISILSKFNNIINEKIMNMDTIMNASVDRLPNDYDVINKSIDSLYVLIKNKIEDIKNNLDRIDIIAKGYVASHMLNNKMFVDEVNSITKIIKELDIDKENNSKISLQIENLEKQKQDIAPFASYLSNILKELNVSLEIVPDINGYYIRNVDERCKLTLNDISEGEINMLSLLFFYYELFDDEQQLIVKRNIDLIVVDDPISSVDDSNRVYIISMIRKLIEFKNSNFQLFVLTHVWDDYFEFTYGLHTDTDKYNFYEIIKKNSISEIRRITRKIETPYKHCFKEIYELSLKKDESDLSDCEIYHYPNSMRKVLEDFLSFKINSSSVAGNKIARICELFCGHSYSQKDFSDVSQIVHLCNIDSHENNRNPNEVLIVAKHLMKYIKKCDEDHFYSIINN